VIPIMSHSNLHHTIQNFDARMMKKFLAPLTVLLVIIHFTVLRRWTKSDTEKKPKKGGRNTSLSFYSIATVAWLAPGVSSCWCKINFLHLVKVSN
jgi:hypothetical protein